MSLNVSTDTGFKKPHESGFTLTELVIVLVILGILSAIGISLFANSGTYATLLARDQFVSTALLAQKRAFANTGTVDNVTLTLVQNTDEWRFQVSQGTTAFTPRTADRKNNQLEIDGTPASVGQSFTFDQRGSVGRNVQLSFSGNGATHRACLGSSGFAYTGNCQP